MKEQGNFLGRFLQVAVLHSRYFLTTFLQESKVEVLYESRQSFIPASPWLGAAEGELHVAGL